MLAPLILSAATSLLALSSTATASPLFHRQNPTNTTELLNRAFLTNCWTNGTSGGARSEVDFFQGYPANFPGNASADTISVVNDGSNFVWDNGGNATVYDGADTFFWSINTLQNVSTLPVGSEVGSAYFNNSLNLYTLVKESEQILYSAGGLDCRVIYGAIQTNEPFDG